MDAVRIITGTLVATRQNGDDLRTVVVVTHLGIDTGKCTTAFVY